VAVVVAVAMPVIEPEAIFATAGGTGLVLTVECVRMPGHRPWATSRVFVRGFLAQSKDSESSKISLWFVSLKGLQGSQGLRDIGEETPVPSMFPGRRAVIANPETSKSFLSEIVTARRSESSCAYCISSEQGGAAVRRYTGLSGNLTTTPASAATEASFVSFTTTARPCRTWRTILWLGNAMICAVAVSLLVAYSAIMILALSKATRCWARDLQVGCRHSMRHGRACYRGAQGGHRSKTRMPWRNV
jgi:hypothetical protein